MIFLAFCFQLFLVLPAVKSKGCCTPPETQKKYRVTFQVLPIWSHWSSHQPRIWWLLLSVSHTISSSRTQEAVTTDLPSMKYSHCRYCNHSPPQIALCFGRSPNESSCLAGRYEPSSYSTAQRSSSWVTNPFRWVFDSSQLVDWPLAFLADLSVLSRTLS